MATSAPKTIRQISYTERDESRECHKRTRPSLKELATDLDQFLDWQLFVLKLGVKKHEIDKIEKNFPQDVDRQKLEAFDHWLRATPDACWENVIAALFDMKENTLAMELTRKYNWKDPRVSVNLKYVSAPHCAHLTAKPVSDDIPCRSFLPPLKSSEQYYTFHTMDCTQMNESLALKVTEGFTRYIHMIRKDNYTLTEFLKSIENSDSKNDFKVGLEARFGKEYWKLNPENVLPTNSTRQEWIQSKPLKKAVFNTEVEACDIDQLFKDRERLGKEVLTRITLKFIVEGQDEGTYSAVIATYESSEMFYLDAVYRDQPIENRARIDCVLPGRKYDFRIGDCSECILLEHKNSTPHEIATTIVGSLCRLPGQKLHLILHGVTSKEESSWIVKYIRQRVQRQYKWKPERQWILARYDIDVFDYRTNKTVKVESAPLNTAVDIPEFDYSRKEVELWGRHIYPKDVNKTHPSKEKYYYIEGVDGVKLPGGEFREPYNWTAEGLMSDFEEFVGDAFKIAHILDGTPY